MTKKVIQTEQAPKAIGPYSQGVAYTGETIVVSGQLPIVPETGEFAGSDIASQTHQSLKNIRAILESAGVGMNAVVSTTVLLADINDFANMNEVYGEYFASPYPARMAFQAAALPKNALVEIQAIAVKG